MLTAGHRATIRRWRRELLSRSGIGFSWRPGRRRDTHSYLLVYEELYRTALDSLATSIAGFRARLHAWFDDYQSKHWPADTPECLLCVDVV